VKDGRGLVCCGRARLLGYSELLGVGPDRASVVELDCVSNARRVLLVAMENDCGHLPVVGALAVFGLEHDSCADFVSHVSLPGLWGEAGLPHGHLYISIAYFWYICQCVENLMKSRENKCLSFPRRRESRQWIPGLSPRMTKRRGRK